jgi:hypothetical protein
MAIRAIIAKSKTAPIVWLRENLTIFILFQLEKQSRIHLELKHFCGLSARIASLPLHRDTADLQITGGRNGHISFTEESSRLFYISQGPF